MKNSFTIIIVALVILSIGFVVFVFIIDPFDSDSNDMGKTTGSNSLTDPTNEEDIIVSNGSRYVNYSERILEQELESGNKVLLLFYADWCPTCTTLEQDLTENINNLQDAISVVKINFDTETELKQKYVVNYQHTFVQLDSEGNRIHKWVGGNINTINANIK